MNEKLKPCPFCGGNPGIAPTIEQVEHDSWVASINCDSCDVSLTPQYTSPSQGEAVSDAIAAWNRRELESASQPGGGEEVSTVDQVMADCEAFEFAMVAAGFNRPDLGKYIGMYRYQRDQDRYTGWKLARAAPSAGIGGAEGAMAEDVTMKMAKASDADMRALLDVVNVIEAIAKGWMPELAADGEIEAPDDDQFDPDDPEHCRYVVDTLLRADKRGGLFRAAFGLTVLLNPKNELVDPDLDHIAKHPKIIKALQTRDWMQTRQEQGVVVNSYAIEDQSTPLLTTIQRASQVDGPDLWKVKRGDSHCLNHDGEWEYEPLPSSRDDEFLARCRYATADEAIDAALKAKAADVPV